MSYDAFLLSKQPKPQACGPVVSESDVNPALFAFQRAMTAWAVRKGRAALWADTGLGKSRMQIEWARLLEAKTLIIAPLGVARQTVREADRIGVTVRYVRSQGDCTEQISITNYEMLHAFDLASFGAVVLDESSILAHLASKTRQALTEGCAHVPYRLCCTATPAPNDIAELANHAEFLGIMRRVEMLAMFFVHDDDGWRLKGHAQDGFYSWLASWAMAVRTPSDLGYPDDGYILPPLSIRPCWVTSGYTPNGQLFSTGIKGITDRTQVRRGTLVDRVAAAAALVNADAEPWVVWCGLNAESDALSAVISGAVNLHGSLSPDEKAHIIEQFQDGAIRVLVTKPGIAGMGLNLQHCARMVFVGISDSWQDYYQCIRRCYRFGQQRPVEVTIVLSDQEDAIYNNVMRKEREATQMRARLVDQAAAHERAELTESVAPDSYTQAEVSGRDWRLLLGDSVERLQSLESASVGLSVFSPPFASLYTYSPTVRDLGNSRTEEEFFTHFAFIIAELFRVTMPGRNCCVHVSQIPAMLERDGYIGLKDFRGATIEAFKRAGWVHHREVCVDKDPQAQAIRTKSKALLFTQMRKDSSWSGPALADYILVFRKPGVNPQAIHPDITNDEWIEWARPIWYGISESDTLQYTTARDAEDERHICPLQLGVIERCIRLWSNPGDLVLDPFAGIGSTPHEAVRLKRRTVGIELKPSYFRVAVANLRRVEVSVAQPSLFDALEVTA